MKALSIVITTASLLALAPAVAFSQAQPEAADKPAAKNGIARNSGGKLSRAAQKAVEERTPVDEEAHVKLSEAELEIAKRVYVGYMPCELGAAVTVLPAKREGFFTVTAKGHAFHMHPAESRTGAIRLEDPRRGALWLQLGNKSMLMSQKLGQRLADECMNPAQQAVAEAMKMNPPPSILDPVAKPAPGAAPSIAPVAAAPVAATPTLSLTPAPTTPSGATVSATASPPLPAASSATQ